MSDKTEIVISEDMVQATERLVQYLITQFETTFANKKQITIGLSGADMVPLLTNELLKHKDKLEPHKSKLVFLACDERFVPLDHEQSNFGEYISRGLFSGLQIATEHQLPITYTATVEECAVDYSGKLEPFLNENNGFDILLMGCGPDGHTCSLFPGHVLFTDAANITELVVSISDSPKPPSQRVTLSLNYINNSTFILFLCGGEEKAKIFKRILTDKDASLPSTNCRSKLSNGVLKWFIDTKSASLL